MHTPHLPGPVWRPWVDDLRGTQSGSAEGPVCTSEQPNRVLPMLNEAPLPPGYDPTRAPEKSFACVLVDADGRVAEAWLAGRGRTGLPSGAVVATILDDWRFSATPGLAPQWVRVRIDMPLRDDSRIR